MRLLLGSDTHFEFRGATCPEPPTDSDYDVVILPGDIDMGTEGMRWARKQFPTKHIIYVLGNHEFYGHDYADMRRQAAELAGADNMMHLLDPGHVGIDDVMFVGATLWSDLDGGANDWYFQKSISDFRVIGNPGEGTPMRRWNPVDHRAAHTFDRAFIDDSLSLEQVDRKRVVVTHFLPSLQCNAPQFAGSPLNPYFAASCDDIMERHRPDLWIFGHTHTVMDLTHEGSGVRMFANPWGYPGEAGARRQWEIIEI